MGNPNRPRMLLILDIEGERAEPRHLEYLKALLAQMLGAEKIERAFWVTRTDLAVDFRGRRGFESYFGVEELRDIADEPRHEPVFDLYVDGGVVPLGRIVNVKIPEWD